MATGAALRVTHLGMTGTTPARGVSEGRNVVDAAPGMRRRRVQPLSRVLGPDLGSHPGDVPFSLALAPDAWVVVLAAAHAPPGPRRAGDSGERVTPPTLLELDLAGRVFPLQLREPLSERGTRLTRPFNLFVRWAHGIETRNVSPSPPSPPSPRLPGLLTGVASGKAGL